MDLHRFALLFLRCFRDIFKPNRFGFCEASVSKANSGDWLYSLGYKRVGMHENYNIRKDAQGIVMMQHYLDRGDHYYSPVKIAHYALASWNDSLILNKEAEKDFWKHINWLRTNCTVTKDGVILWTTPTTNPRYDLQPGYVSAIVQGLVLSALARAYVLSQDPSLLSFMHGVVRLFYVPVEKGGILAECKNGVFYEEYPCIPYSHVVNGFLFAINGLWDARQVGCIAAGELVHAGLTSLKKILPFWIKKDWSYYDLRYLYNYEKRNWSTRHYQYLHADQLTFVFKITKDPVFAISQKTLLKQAENPFAWFKAYLNKATFLSRTRS